jgi:4-amino-4-deoxy-L-arabinose transferase-like glycosyltransferase
MEKSRRGSDFIEAFGQETQSLSFTIATMVGDSGLEAYSTKMDVPVLLGSLLVGVVSTAFLVDFAQVLGFRIPMSWFLLLVSLAAVATLLLPEYFPDLRSRVAYHSQKHPMYVLLVVATIGRLIFGISTGLFPDEYTVLDLLRRIPVSELGSFLYHYTDYAGTLAPHPPLGFLIMTVGYVIYPSALSVRLVSTMFSSASVFLVYAIVTELGKKKEALLVAIFYAILPYSLMLMDLALTDVYMNFFGMLGTWLILRSLRLGTLHLAILSGVSLGLCFWSKSGIPFLWAVLLSIVTLAYRGRIRTLTKRTQYLALAFLAAGAVFGVWWVINPGAFFLANRALFFLIVVTVNPSAYQWFSKNIPMTTGCVSPGPEIDSFSGFLMAIFPRLCRGGLSYVSYPELLVQIPFWITPLILLLSLLGLLRRSGRSRADAIMITWVLVPLLAMIPRYRDIRYLLPFTLGVAYLAARGSSLGRRDLQRRLLGLALTFAIAFNGVAFVVGQQQYYGPPQAVERLQQLGLEGGPILTNWVALEFELPTVEVHETNEVKSVDGLRNLVLNVGIKAVVLFYNARGSPQLPSSEVQSAVKELFSLSYKEGPSEFAWFEIFYEATTDQKQLNPGNAQSTLQSWAKLDDSDRWSDRIPRLVLFSGPTCKRPSGYASENRIPDLRSCHADRMFFLCDPTRSVPHLSTHLVVLN